MAPRFFRSAPDWLWSPRTAYRPAGGVETTELLVMAPSSNSNYHVDTSPQGIFTESKEQKSASQHSKGRFAGWRSGALSFATFASVVFFANLVLTIWGSSYGGGSGVLRDGDCEDIKRWNSGLHAVINLFSTILLGGSNYCMQCLSAPTRKEVDRAHAQGRKLDIGILSYRNLTRISRKRAFLWLLIGFSSLPLHLLYNSAVYAFLSTNSYEVYLVDPAFINDTACRNCTAGSILDDMWNMSKSETLDKLSPAECMTAYNTGIQSYRRNLLLVANDEHALPRINTSSPGTIRFPTQYSKLKSANNTNVLYVYDFDSQSGFMRTDGSLRWIVSSIYNKNNKYRPYPHDFEATKSSADTWSVSAVCNIGLDCAEFEWPVKYCLSEKATPRCQLQFDSRIASIVICLNFFKAVLMFYVVYSTKDDPLMTMGDAVASFLKEKDATTAQLSLFNLHKSRKGADLGGAQTWNGSRARWKDSASRSRRIITITLIICTLMAVLSLLILGIQSIGLASSLNIKEILGLGLGAVNPYAFVMTRTNPFEIGTLPLIVNSPQVILAILYFSYNGLFTAMLMGYEWTSYAHKQKGLRVSSKPKGSQRSTYFLQLPYRFGLPLIVLSGILHWLVSQGFFIVALSLYDSRGRVRTDVYKQGIRVCGFSPIAMLIVLIIGVLMTLVVIGVGFIPYKRGMPLAGNSSMAISAACHPPGKQASGGETMSEQELQWGVVETSVDGIGRCAFSSKEVGPLIKGRMYS